MSDNTLGQIAYEAFADCFMDGWSELTDFQRLHWEKAAAAVTQQSSRMTVAKLHELVESWRSRAAVFRSQPGVALAFQHCAEALEKALEHT